MTCGLPDYPTTGPVVYHPRVHAASGGDTVKPLPWQFAVQRTITMMQASVVNGLLAP
ncbi:hypothetical protein BH23CHL3_BH23CHL3_07030 [soil metagenome]